MAVEAQRLIAISLGKMASSRAQRGGARLHKSLLVASVLHSAQTVALLNDQQNLDLTLHLQPSNISVPSEPSIVSDYGELDRKVVDEASIVGQTVSPLFDDRKYSELRARRDDDSESEDEVELVTLTSCFNTTQTDELGSFTPAVEELASSANCFNTLVNSTVNCAQFLSSQQQSPARKRCRSGEDDEPLAKHLRFSLSTDYSTCCSVEPMQTDSWQVTSLVYSFSMGFSGLLRNSDASEFSSSDSTESEQPIYMHSSTSESIISCSTQIREALDTLTRPAIAMTV